jgi:hypothetical protein
LWLPV